MGTLLIYNLDFLMFCHPTCPKITLSMRGNIFTFTFIYLFIYFNLIRTCRIIEVKTDDHLLNCWIGILCIKRTKMISTSDSEKSSRESNSKYAPFIKWTHLTIYCLKIDNQSKDILYYYYWIHSNNINHLTYVHFDEWRELGSPRTGVQKKLGRE
jgi:hypothetical protein